MIKHGMSRTKIYHTLSNMKDRCHNPACKSYNDYGGRGIIVCDEWLNKENGFINFYNWSISNGYEEHLTIDRINNDGNYEPSNCRWVTMKEQNNNMRKTRYIYYKGVKYSRSQICEKYNMSYTTLCRRLDKFGWSIEKTLNTPLRLDIIKMYNYNDKEYTISELSKLSGISENILYGRIHSHKWTVEKSMTTPQKRFYKKC